MSFRRQIVERVSFRSSIRRVAAALIDFVIVEPILAAQAALARRRSDGVRW